MNDNEINKEPCDSCETCDCENSCDCGEENCECGEQSEEITALKKEIDTLNDKYARALAEYDNFRKRSFKEKENIAVNAKSSVILELLPVIDSLLGAKATLSGDIDSYKKGIELIFTQFQSYLEKIGVSEIKALNEEFDPNLHNAVMHIDDENFSANTVCEEFQKGYTLNDKVIRHSMVKVAN